MIATLFSRFKRRTNPAPGLSPLLVVMPHICFGGAERWAAAIVRELHAEERPVILVVLGDKPGEKSAADAWFSPYVTATHLADAWEKQYPASLLGDLAQKWNASSVILIGHSPAYPALPRLRALRPALHIVSFQFNAVDLREEHLRFAPYLDAVIVEGTDVAERLIEGGFPDGKIFHVPSAIRLPAFSRPPPKPVRERGLRVGFVGRMDPHSKNPRTFVEMAGRLQPLGLHFLMIGDGPEAAWIDPWIQEHQGSVSLHLIRHVSDEQLIEHLASLDILVVPSLKDGRPLVIREAQALQVPVIASRVGSIPELLLDGAAGILCEPGNVSEFAEAVTRLAENPALRRQLADAGHQHALRESDIRRTMPLLKKILFGSL